jgi:hypothetical protein
MRTRHGSVDLCESSSGRQLCQVEPKIVAALLLFEVR